MISRVAEIREWTLASGFAKLDSVITHRQIAGGSGLILELHRPQSLNALDLEAFIELHRLLTEAEQSSQVEFVVIWAPPESNRKAFCAGGDVRRLYTEHQKSGDFRYSAQFFENEYRVDQRVWNFKKPIIALTHGITMGGGIGLIRGANYRVITETSLWAMPEISIGLYPDVGATHFLGLLPAVWARFIGLCGARLLAPDLLALGLATHLCRQEHLSKIVEALDSEGIGALAEFEGVSFRAGHADATSALDLRSWKSDWKDIEFIFGDEAWNRSTDGMEIWNRARSRLQDGAISPELRTALETLLTGSPISCRVILKQLQWNSPAQRDRPLAATFDWEYRTSMACLEKGDFLEGVRSRLIDKDFREPGKPQWKFATPAAVPDSLIQELTGA